MFSIVSALDKSGVLTVVSAKMLSKARNNPSLILLVFVVGMGLLSAFLVNDTIAVLGIPFVVYFSRHIGIRPQVLLIALAYGITVGSTMTPIGNPQNLLIALQSRIPLPFITFLRYLGIPTIVNLFLTFLILKVYFRKELSLLFLGSHTINAANTSSSVQRQSDAMIQERIKQENLIGNDYDGKNIKDYWSKEDISIPDLSAAQATRLTNPRLAKISIGILLATIAGFIISDILQFTYPRTTTNLSLSIIAMLGATALYALSKERREILVSVDYSVLVFFAAMLYLLMVYGLLALYSWLYPIFLHLTRMIFFRAMLQFPPLV
jgi:Na+/H+ antiporter NhaD/arsenite permease-like protein